MATSLSSRLRAFADLYLSFDRRTLALTRVALGSLLIFDLFRRTPDWLAMFSDKGVLPSQFLLQRPQSDGFTIFTAFNTAGELWALWAVGLAAYVCLLVGYKTKVAQVVSLVFVTSMNGRVLFIENGGYVVQNLLLLWTAFLPLGDRFSVDALLASLRRRRARGEADLDAARALPVSLSGPHVTIIGAALVLQIGALYFFNVVHKTGSAWTNGTAVHYVLYNDRMITPLLANVRDYVPNVMIQMLTRGTLAIEAGIVVLLLSPFARPWARRGVFFGMCALHIGFGMSFTLGPFAWSCCTFATLFIGREDWEVVGRTMKRLHRARTVLFDRASERALFACELLARADRFGLLRFQAYDGPGLAVAGAGEGGEPVRGAAAYADIVSALPLGPLFALPLRLVASLAQKAQGAPAVPADMASRGGSPAIPEEASLPRAWSLAAVSARELLAALMIAAAVNQALVELWVARPLHARQGAVMAALSHKMRFLQGWFMFSPNPVMDDGTIVVDAITTDGRHVDPFTGRPPNFDLTHAKSLRLNQIWGDYFNRIRLPGNLAYRDAAKAYMLRLPERTGRPEDAIVSGDVYWVTDLNPPWGQTESYQYQKNKLWSFEGPSKVASAGRGEMR